MMAFQARFVHALSSARSDRSIRVLLLTFPVLLLPPSGHSSTTCTRADQVARHADNYKLRSACCSSYSL